ncbi:MAG: hypothetical protein ACLGH0_03645, partial [Thermoanaerobaculia bacterium]
MHACQSAVTAKVLAFAAFVFIALPTFATPPDYDIRDDRDAADVLDRYRARTDRARIREKKEKIRGAVERMKRDAPGVEVELSAHTGAPEIVRVASGPQKLAGKSQEPREHVARAFLQRNAELYGLSPSEVAHLKKTADFANPSGNLAWVELRQELNGLPIFRGRIRLAITTEGEIAHTTGNLVPALDDAPQERTPTISAAAALAIAAESIGIALPEAVLKEQSA